MSIVKTTEISNTGTVITLEINIITGKVTGATELWGIGDRRRIHIADLDTHLDAKTIGKAIEIALATAPQGL